MKVLVHGRNVVITDWIEEYVDKKVQKLERLLPNLNEVRTEITQMAAKSAADRYTVQITMWSSGQILRAEETTGDIFASIDAAVDKVSRQIERFKGRVTHERRRTTASVAAQSELVAAAVAAADTEPEEQVGQIIRRKQFVILPMDEAEALEQMELLGHDFFVFFNPDSRVANIIYRRKDGNYGLLEPQIA